MVLVLVVVEFIFKSSIFLGHVIFLLHHLLCDTGQVIQFLSLLLFLSIKWRLAYLSY